MKLSALYKIERQYPAFVLPLFSDGEDRFFAQCGEIKSKLVESFRPFRNPDESRLLQEDIKNLAITQSIGDPIIAFLFLDANTYEFDRANSTEKKFSSGEIGRYLREFPFALLEVGRFYDSPEVIRMAAISCAKHLSDSSKELAKGWIVGSELSEEVKRAVILSQIVSTPDRSYRSHRVVYKISRRFMAVVSELSKRYEIRRKSDLIINSLEEINRGSKSEFIEFLANNSVTASSFLISQNIDMPLFSNIERKIPTLSLVDLIALPELRRNIRFKIAKKNNRYESQKSFFSHIDTKEFRSSRSFMLEISKTDDLMRTSIVMPDHLRAMVVRDIIPVFFQRFASDVRMPFEIVFGIVLSMAVCFNQRELFQDLLNFEYE